MNKPGKIIIVEGIWGAGKSTLIKAAIKKFKAKYIPEPNQFLARILSKDTRYITKWYFKAHENNFKKAGAIARTGKVVFVERSCLSSVAFSKVYLKSKKDAEMRRFGNNIKNLRDRQHINTYFIYLKPRKMKNAFEAIKRNPHLKTRGGIKFLRSVDYQLRFAIQEMKKEKLILVYNNPTLKSLAKILK